MKTEYLKSLPVGSHVIGLETGSTYKIIEHLEDEVVCELVTLGRGTLEVGKRYAIPYYNLTTDVWKLMEAL